MLFNSRIFLFAFLPITLAVVLGLGRLASKTAAKVALVSASLVFYAWWNPRYVVLLVALIGFNYLLATIMLRMARPPGGARLAVLLLGLGGNLGALIYFKYANFAFGLLSRLVGHRLPFLDVVLPLGISFITFQKIAFLVDVYAGTVEGVTLLDYALFVTFFPQLIAGPIVHHRDVIPQLERPESLRFSPSAMACGLTLFTIGLFKKVVLADSLAPHAAAVFSAAAAGARPDLASSWSGAVHYLLQLYFDFSGYSDMAVGLGLMFGIHLPFNFNSPYKANNVIEYWQRWHITLTRFLTAYVYNPLVLWLTRRRMARGKKSMSRGRMTASAFVTLLVLPTIFTMFVSGLWHGAGLQFIALGLLHGLYLSVNHAYRTFRPRPKGQAPAPSVIGVVLSRVATLLAVLAGLVFFRASSVHSALAVLKGMVGRSGAGHVEIQHEPLRLLFLVALAAATQVLPSSQEFLGEPLRALRASLPEGLRDIGDASAAARIFTWRPTMAWGLCVAAIAFGSLLGISDQSAFLYFNF